MNKKVLIIDDSAFVLNMLKDMLEEKCFSCLTAEDGEKGVAVAISDKPDIVICDTLLPGIDGFEACRQIREQLNSETTKIIVMTGTADAIDAVKAREVGADDYCAKTSDFSVLIKAIEKI